MKDRTGRENAGWPESARVKARAKLSARALARRKAVCGCGKPVKVFSRGLCGACYFRWYKTTY